MSYELFVSLRHWRVLEFAIAGVKICFEALDQKHVEWGGVKVEHLGQVSAAELVGSCWLVQELVLLWGWY